MIDVNDDGTMLYLDMGNAEYGIVNDRALTYYDGNTVRKIADDVMDYRYLDTEDLIYYTDKDGNLFAYYDGITKKPIIMWIPSAIMPWMRIMHTI